MNIMFLGSCLSSLTIKSFLKKSINNVELKSCFTHLRSDFACSVIDNGRSFGCDSSKINSIKNQLGALLADSNQRRMLSNRINAQSAGKLERLTEGLRVSDFLLFDNNYDLGRFLHYVDFEGSKYRFSNLNVPASEHVEVSPALTADEIKDYELALLNKIVSINPSIQIFFLNYPVTAFERRAKVADITRANNARSVNKFMREGIENGSVPENVTFIGCIDLPDHLLSKKGALYFEDQAYETFAALIKRKLEGALEGRYFDDFAALQSQLGLKTPKSLQPNQSPYANLPDRQYWKPAVADPYPLAINDLYRKKFDIGIEDGVATCGSCFAQHIGKRLDRKGYNYMDVEPVPAELAVEKAKSLGYGIYSARYGNVYTSRQLVQLFERAFGKRRFDEVWQNKEGHYVDPFRPNLCGNGYATPDEVLEEQQKHLKQVRHMFETLDVFVFTMGVTETWVNRETGAAYPICPGVTAGTFDPEQTEFINLDYTTILAEVETFLSYLRDVNPSAKVLLTVSPVPLTATAEKRHVLLSTMASKSILRSVADQLYRRHAHVDYFPSYDIIMSPPFKSMFFKNNLRSIHEEGVDYVMSHFFAQHQLGEQFADNSKKLDGSQAPQNLTPAETIEEIDDEAFCDEAFLELERKTNQSES